MKSSILNLAQKLHWLAALAIGLSLWAGQLPVLANSRPFSQIVVFGDSTSDTGNCYQMYRGAYPPSDAVPPAKWGYWEGHFSNGPMWVEYLAEDLGMAGLLDNYAVGGAASGTDNNGFPFGGVKDQLGRYFSSHQGDTDALYILFAGHNDVFRVLGADPTGALTAFAENTVYNIETLWAAGARHILVLNVLDVGKCPGILVWGSDFSAYVSQLVTAFNQSLASTLNGLATEGKPTIALDACTFLDTVIADPAQFGFSNVTDQGIMVDDPTGYFFWDSAHPTTQFHLEFAQFVARGLIDYFSPSRGQGMPPAQVNALNGLVRAGKGQ